MNEGGNDLEPKSLSIELIEELKKIFDSIDIDGSGHISTEELSNFLKDLEDGITEEKVT